MPRVGKRTTIEPGIYRDARGYEVCVSLRRERASKRFPAGTDRTTLRLARGQLLARLHREASAHGKPGTLAADVRAYLSGFVKDSTAHRNAAYLLGCWVEALGDRPRAQITAEDIRAACGRWLSEGYAPGTVNRRRSALVALYIAHGERGTHPLRHVPQLPEQVEARDIPRAAVDAILAQLPHRTKAGRWWRAPLHLRVLAETGIPHKMIGEITDSDLHLDGPDPYVIVKPRKKGKGHPGKRLYLTPAAVAAFRDMREATAFGPVNRDVIHRMFREAVAKARAAWQGPWPVDPRVSPYWLRHAFANRLVEVAQGDLTAVQEQLIHSDLRTTQRYTRTTVSARAKAAIKALGAVQSTAPRENRRKSAR
jgi:integrase